MVPATTKCRVLRFGVFELDLESRELRKRGIRVKLAGQSFHALLLLLEPLLFFLPPLIAVAAALTPAPAEPAAAVRPS